MNAHEYVAGLVDEMQTLFSQLGEEETLESESDGNVEVVTLLKLALASELEASEIAGSWMPTTPELDAKMALAQQCGDEMRHYQLITQRLAELGENLEGFDVLAEGYSPLHTYLQSLTSTVERIAAGPFAGEAIAEVRNAQFIAFCRRIGDGKTAKLYEDIIHPEEIHHHQAGRRILERYADTPELQEKAATAMRTTLAIADELRTLTEKTTGMHHIPSS